MKTYKLLRLPWTDVLTTNWDTLLERTTDKYHDRPYSIVGVPSDIAHAGSPRIVKLHGSLPSGPFIFTEEDFRTYPDKFAPFVNLARQALLENELCLIGFSSKDPNFLQWSGWVRDQLRDLARPVRLIGSLNLTNSQRSLLESRNITPIDFWPIVKNCAEEDQHQQAIEYFLEYLELGRPRKAFWKLITLEDEISGLADSEARLKRLTDIWKEQRESYPGWLVAPRRYRQELRMYSFQSYFADLSETSVSRKVRLLYETVWRWETAFWPLPIEIDNALDEVVSNNTDIGLLKIEQRIYIRAAMARAARSKRDWIKFDKYVQYLRNLEVEDANIEATYELCLKARDELDYNYISDNLDKITISNNDPVWLLRKGALAMEALNLNAAAEPIKLAFHEIQERRGKDRHSFWLISREAWACFILRQVNRATDYRLDEPEWLPEYKENECDPLEEIRYLERQIEEMENDQVEYSQDLQPRFDAGSYSIPGRKMYGHTATFPVSEISRLTEHVGIPLSIGNIRFLSNQFGKAVRVSENNIDRRLWAFIRSVATDNQRIKQTDTRISRLAIVSLSEEVVSDIAKKIRHAIDFVLTIRQQGKTSEQKELYMTRIHNLTEILSRFAVITRDDKAKELYHFGLYLSNYIGDDLQTPWESVDNLLRRSLEAIDPDKRNELVLEALDLPLLDNSVFKNFESRFKIFDQFGHETWKRMKGSNRWKSTINKLIEAAGQDPDNPERQDATYRLFHVFIAGALTKQQGKAFGEAVWRHIGKDGLPCGVQGMLFQPHAFLSIPSQNSVVAKEAFDSAIVQELADGNISATRLKGLTGASFLSNKNRYEPYTLNSSDAIAIFNQALTWKPKPQFFPLMRSEDPDISNYWLGQTLAATVLPSLEPTEIQDIDIHMLFKRISDDTIPSFMMALPELVRLEKVTFETAVNIIQGKLISLNGVIARAALNAIYWFHLVSDRSEVAMPEELIDDLVSICTMQRESVLKQSLEVLHLLVKTGTTKSVPDKYWKKLMASLCVLSEQMDYESNIEDPRQSDIGMIRRNALRLVVALKESGMELSPELEKWITDAISDPLPEVRHALYPN